MCLCLSHFELRIIILISVLISILCDWGVCSCLCVCVLGNVAFVGMYMNIQNYDEIIILFEI